MTVAASFPRIAVAPSASTLSIPLVGAIPGTHLGRETPPLCAFIFLHAQCECMDFLGNSANGGGWKRVGEARSGLRVTCSDQLS